MSDPRWPHLDPLRINLGCARFFKPGWLNLDAVPQPGHEQVDFLRADLRQPLPFLDGSVDEAYCGHLFEHLPRPVELAGELHRVLARGARCGIVVPDAAVAWHQYHQGRLPAWFLTSLVFGDPATGDYAHYNVWTQASLEVLCWAAGFRRIAPLDPLHDPRLSAPADWQCGVDVWKE